MKVKKIITTQKGKKWLPGAGGGENRERLVKGTNFQL